MNIALDGVRAGGCKYLVAAMWSAERGQSMWMPPQALPWRPGCFAHCGLDWSSAILDRPTLLVRVVLAQSLWV